MCKQLKSFTKECIDHYATFNHYNEFYSLEVEALPDFVKHEFAALIIGSDESWAHEASGPDNNHWDNKMLPALTRYLANSTDKDEANEFTKIWRDCIADHMTSKMQNLINEALNAFNSDYGYSHTASYYYGVPSHGPF